MASESVIPEMPANALADPLRPRYHFTTPWGWLNDPNGTVFWRGRWHMFYQCVPERLKTGGGAAHWGHAVSEDLIHWRHLPLAISPEPGSCDEKGCWSGTAMVDGGRVIAHYHAHQGGNCIATASDDLLTDWTKHPANPVIPFEQEKTYDPCIWKEGDVWHAISGRITGAARPNALDPTTGGRDVAYLFKSRDLEHWDFGGEFYRGGEFTNPGEDCACPDFFAIGGSHMLLFLSHNQGAQYYIGDYAGGRFTPRRHGRMNFTVPLISRLGACGDFAAPIAWKGPKERRTVIAWVPEGRSFEAMQRAGWAGVMSLPRDISLLADGTLGVQPVPELAALRRGHSSASGIALGEQPVEVEGAFGDSLEIHAVFEPGDARAVYVTVRRSPGGEEGTSISVDLQAGTLTIDPSRASVSPDVVGTDAQVAPFALQPGELLDLHVFIDRSIVEVFANGRHCVTKRIYPSRPDSTGVRFHSEGAPCVLRSLDAWEMAGAEG